METKESTNFTGLKNFTLKEIKEMPATDIMSIINCGGNRRTDMYKMFDNEVKGLKWTIGAISNAKYKGVTILELMKQSGLDPEEFKGKDKHLLIYSLDADFQGEHYNVSIPLDRALDPENKVIIAYQ